MKAEWRAAAAVVLAVVILLLGAYIPKLIGLLIDLKDAGQVSMDPIESVELKLQQSVSPVGRLVMMSRIERLIPIADSKARLTREQVTEAVNSELAPYLDQQLAVFRPVYTEMRPYLVGISDMLQLQRVIWLVTVAGDEADYTFYDLVIDDETGKILRISYTAEQPLEAITGREAVTLFADIFFSSLGVEDFWSCAVPDLDNAYVGDGADGIRFRFWDARYGQVDVDLYVHDCGFYMEFPATRRVS